MSTITTTERRVAASAVEVSKAYGAGEASVLALDAVTVDFAAGQFTAIMGPSGSGKSTLLHSLAGLDRPTSGEIRLGGVDITTLNDRDLTLLRRDKLGFIFQAFNLLPTLTAAENITLPVRIAGRKPDAYWVDTIIDAVGLRPRLSHRPAELSGGQQQRVAAARALASRPETVVMVTHDPVAASYADRVVFLSDGQIVDEMTQPTADAVLDYMKRLGA